MRLLIIILLGLLVSPILQAQFFQPANFFTGDDAKLMKTTYKGLGSISVPLTSNFTFSLTKKENAKIAPFAGIGLGVIWKKHRFKNNYVFEEVNGVTVFVPDDSLHQYEDVFFSYSKSKLVAFTFRIEGEIGLRINQWLTIGTGPVFDYILNVKHKRKYKDATDNKVKFVDKDNDYNINKAQLGWKYSIGGMSSGLYVIQPFGDYFEEGKGPSVRNWEIGIYSRVYIPANRSKERIKDRMTMID